MTPEHLQEVANSQGSGYLLEMEGFRPEGIEAVASEIEKHKEQIHANVR